MLTECVLTDRFGVGKASLRTQVAKGAEVESLNVSLRLRKGITAHVTSVGDHVVIENDEVAFMDIFVYDEMAARQLANALIDAADVAGKPND